MLVPATEVHHILRRGKSDEPETCISLCSKCHQNHHNGTGVKTEDFMGLMTELYGYQYDGCKALARSIALSGN